MEQEIKADNKQRRPHRRSSVNLLWASVCSLALLLCCWMNGNSESSHFILAAVTGTGLLLLPPRRRLPLPPLAAVAALLILASAALLPASWLSTGETWRTSLRENWQIALPDRVSPQPFLTQGALLTLTSASLWFLMLMGRAFDEQARRLVLTVAALGMAGIAAAALAERFGYVATSWPYHAAHASHLDMGPFLNRNHFSGFCAIACVLCAGLARDGLKRRSPWWPVFPAALLAPFSAIAMNTSRGGLMLFFVGMLAWLAFTFTRHGVFSKLTVMASLSLTAIAILILYGEGSFNRLSTEKLEDPQGSLGLRGTLYAEVIPLALSRFWTGAGLGNFSAVYALEQKLRLPNLQVLHPESDWLWLAFEAGLPALVPVVLALAWLLGPLLSAKTDLSRSARRDFNLRATAGIGATLAAIHALFDVPMHNMTLACLALLLAACAVPRRNLDRDAGWISRSLFRLSGAGLLILAAGHYSGLQGSPIVPGRFHVNSLAAKARAEFDQGRLSQAMESLDTAIARAPLRWDLYYQRAVVRLELRQPPDEALDDFNRARALKPGLIPLRMEEGRYWLRHHPEYAVVPWRELLAIQDSADLYQTMLDLSRPYPELRSALLKLARTPPLMAAHLLKADSQDEWQRALDALLQANPELDRLTSTQRAAVLRSWAERGDASLLLARAQDLPAWEKDAWPLLADELAKRTEFERAWKLLKKYAYSTTGIETNSSLPLGELERHFLQYPSDLKKGIDLYFAQKQRSLYTEAGRTLEKLLAQSSAPRWLHQEQADLLAASGDFRRAYETMKATLNHSQ